MTSSVYYVYVLFDWMGIPRYVGKGKGQRWLMHERKTDPINWLKNEFIERTWIMLGEIPKVKIRDGLSEQNALALETTFIQAIGRFPEGPLTNLTDGGPLDLAYRSRLAEAVKRWHKTRSPEERKAAMAHASQFRLPVPTSQLVTMSKLHWDNPSARQDASERLKSWWSAFTNEERSNISRHRWHSRPIGNRGLQSWSISVANMTAEQLSARAKKRWDGKPRRWITNGHMDRSILMTDPIPCGWRHGRSTARGKSSLIESNDSC